MWDLIVSVPDHCLSFYFTYSRWCPKWLPDFYMSDGMFQLFNYVVVKTGKF